jgi:hypothetical protein
MASISAWWAAKAASNAGKKCCGAIDAKGGTWKGVSQEDRRGLLAFVISPL